MCPREPRLPLDRTATASWGKPRSGRGPEENVGFARRKLPNRRRSSDTRGRRRFLVASRFMRAFYGMAKAVVFCQLYLTHALVLNNPGVLATLQPLNTILILLAVTLCVLRGIPVLLDGRIYFASGKAQD